MFVGTFELCLKMLQIVRSFHHFFQIPVGNKDRIVVNATKFLLCQRSFHPFQLDTVAQGRERVRMDGVCQVLTPGTANAMS